MERTWNQNQSTGIATGIQHTIKQLPDDACRDTAKPPTFEPCNVQDCPKWITREWSGVSVLFCYCYYFFVVVVFVKKKIQITYDYLSKSKSFKLIPYFFPTDIWAKLGSKFWVYMRKKRMQRHSWCVVLLLCTLHTTIINICLDEIFFCIHIRVLHYLLFYYIRVTKKNVEKI